MKPFPSRLVPWIASILTRASPRIMPRRARVPGVSCNVTLNSTAIARCPALVSALAPQPDPQSRKDDEDQNADPEGYVDIARSHFDPQEDAKQLRKGDQPEEDRGYQRRWLLHLNAPSSPMTCSTQRRDNGEGECERSRDR